MLTGPSGTALWRQYGAAVVSQLSTAAAGAAFVWTEPLVTKISQPHFDGVPMTADQMSWLIAILDVGCIIATIPFGYLADWYGRKYVILSVGPMCLLGWILILVTRSLNVLYFVRVFHGLPVAVAHTVSPIYPAETADPAIRGALSGLFQVAFYGGCTYSFCIGPYVSYQWYTIISMVLPIVFTVAFVFFPESPYWLIKKGKYEEAKKSLRWFRAEEDVDKVINSMKLAVQEEMGTKDGSWKTLFTEKYERKAFLIVFIIAFTKFFTGMPTIVSYASHTFAKSDGFLGPSETTIVLGVLLAVIGALSALMSDRVGRKTLLIVSCFGSFLAHFFTAAYYYLHEKTAIDAKPYIWVMYLGIAMYCFFAGIGLGPLLQTLQAELFGANTREVAGGIISSIGTAICLIVVRMYQPINDEYGVYVNFLVYAIVGLVGGILLVVLMYESAGKAIGRMEGREQLVQN